MEYFSTRQASALSGLSPEMVDYLCRQKVVTPSGHGRQGRGRGLHRRYTFGDLVLLRSLAKLLNAGVSVKRVREALKNWKRYISSISKQDMPSRRYLVTDGERVFFESPDGLLTGLNENGQMSFGFILDISVVVQELQEEIHAA